MAYLPLDLLADLPPVLTSHVRDELKLADLPLDLLEDLPPKCIMGIYYGMYLIAILDSARKGGNFLLFVNNEVSKQSVSIVQSCQM